ncbi:hypothetical protein BDR05DRAFT_951341 [Suillus weaverae]|nr:hypothetical protein BDR05DRAFT_951341 [Suillus weaverae]
MPGLKTFIERYQTTLTVVMASLSREELEEAQNTAIEWSAKTPPAAVQADFAKKKAPGLMKDLASKLWKAIARKGSDTRPKDLVKKCTRKHTRRVEQESSSEDEEKDNDNDNDNDNGTSPPPKSKPGKNCLLVKKSRPSQPMQQG